VLVWREPQQSYHPLTGIAEALRRAAPRPIVVCGVDMPLVSAALVCALASQLAAARGEGLRAVIARGAGCLQPLAGAYAPEALALLGEAGDARRLVDAVECLEPAILDWDARELVNVNTLRDLAAVEAALSAGGASASPPLA
jgi:molybdopterin-guanine dinucleotide biosynthesis protein A